MVAGVDPGLGDIVETEGNLLGDTELDAPGRSIQRQSPRSGASSESGILTRSTLVCSTSYGEVDAVDAKDTVNAAVHRTKLHDGDGHDGGSRDSSSANRPVPFPGHWRNLHLAIDMRKTAAAGESARGRG